MDLTELDLPAAVAKISLHGPAVVVGLCGDAQPAHPVPPTGYVRRFAVHGRRTPILDLADMGFLGLEGARAVLGLGELCGRYSAAWTLASGRLLIGLPHAFERGDPSGG